MVGSSSRDREKTVAVCASVPDTKYYTYIGTKSFTQECFAPLRIDRKNVYDVKLLLPKIPLTQRYKVFTRKPPTDPVWQRCNRQPTTLPSYIYVKI